MPFQHALTPDAALELRNIRTFLGWTQPALADALGTSAGAVSSWETGTKLVPSPVLRLLRYLALTTPPSTGFIPVVADPEPQAVHVRPGVRCLWRHNDELPCAGRLFRAEAQVSRRRHLETETCEVHLHSAFAVVFHKLAEAARAEQRRLAGRKRKQAARQRAREAMAQTASVGIQP